LVVSELQFVRIGRIDVDLHDASVLQSEQELSVIGFFTYSLIVRASGRAPKPVVTARRANQQLCP
jgi:hypothetical protein